MDRRSAAAAAIAAALAAASLLAAAATGGTVSPASGYAAVELAECADPRYRDDGAGVRALREAGAPAVVSESSELVYLDAFDGLEAVPLHLWNERVEPFDPRDDGFAARLSSFYVSGGRRRFFVPVGGLGAPSRRKVARVAGEAFAGLEHTVSYPPAVRFPRSSAILALAGLAACMAAAFFVRRSGLAALFASGPALAAYALASPVGAAAAALAAAAVLRSETFLRERARARAASAKRSPRVLDGAAASAALLLASLAASLASGAHPAAALLAAAAVAAAAAAKAAVEEARRAERGHGRFHPLPIVGAREGHPRAVLPAAPLALAAVVSLFFLPQAAPPPSSSFPTLGLGAEDFRAHLAFQSGFSSSRLGAPEEAYQQYRLGAEGLFEEAEAQARPRPPAVQEPKALRVALPAVAAAAGARGRRAGVGAGALAAVAAAVLACLPAAGAIVSDRRRNSSLSGFVEKRIAA